VPATSTTQELRREQGFDAYVLRSDRLEVVVVPELGSKVTSLKNLRTGREWMWSPEWRGRLYRNRPADNFATGTLVGWDECLPTIGPCRWKGRELPDHGEVWSAAWQVDGEAWRKGQLQTSIDLPISPLRFTRLLKIEGAEVIASYMLTNRGSERERFIWAMHPLLRMEPGDRLELARFADGLMAAEPWLANLECGPLDPPCAKRFVDARRESPATATAANDRTGDRLTITWSPSENDTLGLWLTRGGWHGHHHLAIEPTNAADDSLARAVELDHCGAIAAGATISWEVTVTLQP